MGPVGQVRVYAFVRDSAPSPAAGRARPRPRPRLPAAPRVVRACPRVVRRLRGCRGPRPDRVGRHPAQVVEARAAADLHVAAVAAHREQQGRPCGSALEDGHQGGRGEHL